MLYQKLIFLIILTHLFSCAQRAKIPINRFHTSETLGQSFGVEYQQGGFSKGSLVFTGEDINGPMKMTTEIDKTFQGNLSVVDNLDLFVQVPNQSATRGGIKIQLLGSPSFKPTVGHSLAVTLAGGYAQDEFKSALKIDLKASMRDFSIIHGYRMNQYFMIYEGVSVTDYSYEGKILNPGELPGDTFAYHTPETYGAFLGCSFGTSQISAAAEIAAQRVKWTNTPVQNFFSFGYRLQISF